jgi:hypothetical protein
MQPYLNIKQKIGLYQSDNLENVTTKRRKKVLWSKLSLAFNKYKDGVTYTDAASVIRYAEVVLNMAEAQARTNNLGTALTLLNSVRNRALKSYNRSLHISNFVFYTTYGSAVILQEKIEFLMGRRWSDIGSADDLFPIDGIQASCQWLGNCSYVYSTTPYTGPYGEAAIQALILEFWPIPLLELNNNQH